MILRKITSVEKIKLVLGELLSFFGKPAALKHGVKCSLMEEII